jgi:hypothetical protein
LTTEELIDMFTEARIENEMLMEEKKTRSRDDECGTRESLQGKRRSTIR